MPGRIAIVESDVDGIHLSARLFINLGAHAFQVGQVSRGRHILAGCRARVGIHGIDQIVLIAGFVLHEQDKSSVAAPEITRDWSRGIGSDWFRLFKWFFAAFDPDVARAFERLDKGDEFPVR